MAGAVLSAIPANRFESSGRNSISTILHKLPTGSGTAQKNNLCLFCFNLFPGACQVISLEAHITRAGAVRLSRPESSAEMPQEGRFFHNLQPFDFRLALVHFQNRFHHIVDVALRVHPAWNRQP